MSQFRATQHNSLANQSSRTQLFLSSSLVWSVCFDSGYIEDNRKRNLIDNLTRRSKKKLSQTQERWGNSPFQVACPLVANSSLNHARQQQVSRSFFFEEKKKTAHVLSAFSEVISLLLVPVGDPNLSGLVLNNNHAPPSPRARIPAFASIFPLVHPPRLFSLPAVTYVESPLGRRGRQPEVCVVWTAVAAENQRFCRNASHSRRWFSTLLFFSTVFAPRSRNVLKNVCVPSAPLASDFPPGSSRSRRMMPYRKKNSSPDLKAFILGGEAKRRASCCWSLRGASRSQEAASSRKVPGG